jgi:hypothetical protein
MDQIRMRFRVLNKTLILYSAQAVSCEKKHYWFVGNDCATPSHLDLSLPRMGAVAVTRVKMVAKWVGARSQRWLMTKLDFGVGWQWERRLNYGQLTGSDGAACQRSGGGSCAQG